jgi:hypothetical protein
LGTLRTGLLVVSETLVPDFRVVVDCRLVCWRTVGEVGRTVETRVDEETEQI